MLSRFMHGSKAGVHELAVKDGGCRGKEKKGKGFGALVSGKVRLGLFCVRRNCDVERLGLLRRPIPDRFGDIPPQ